MNIQVALERWRTHPEVEEQMKQQLEKINHEELFGRTLSFGTGGVRGVMGPGPNRMNIFTARNIAGALVNHLKEHLRAPRVAIAYDSRMASASLAQEMARVLADSGVHVSIFNELMPTPLLSFAVRQLEADAGIVITASHNPPEYNGIKIYNADGAQITETMATDIAARLKSEAEVMAGRYASFQDLLERELITYMPHDVLATYSEQVTQLSLSDARDVRIVFTPLHGTAYRPMQQLFADIGFRDVHYVASQVEPDPLFSTVASPNPEEASAFELGIDLAADVHADVVMATDPDADRLGIAVHDGSGYRLINGNELGALLIDYIVQFNLPDHGYVVKSIVSSDLGTKIATAHGLNVAETLTGFKYIGEYIGKQETGSFVFGYEESYGYLLGDFCRDKDALQTAVMVAEMTAYWKAQGHTLFDRLEVIWSEHGYHQEALLSYTWAGSAGQGNMRRIMAHLREAGLAIEGVLQTEDYWLGHRVLTSGEQERLQLPQADVLKFKFANGWIALRPSGTEPKMKVYIGCFGAKQETKDQVESFTQQIRQMIELNSKI